MAAEKNTIEIIRYMLKMNEELKKVEISKSFHAISNPALLFNQNEFRLQDWLPLAYHSVIHRDARSNGIHVQLKLPLLGTAPTNFCA